MGGVKSSMIGRFAIIRSSTRMGRQKPSRARTSRFAAPSRRPSVPPATMSCTRCSLPAGPPEKVCCATLTRVPPWLSRMSTDSTPPRVARRTSVIGVRAPMNCGTGWNSTRTAGTLCRHARYPIAPSTRRMGTTKMMSHTRALERATKPC